MSKKIKVEFSQNIQPKIMEISFGFAWFSSTYCE